MQVNDAPIFDTVSVSVKDAAAVAELARQHQMNVRVLNPTTVSVAFDETSRLPDVDALFKVSLSAVATRGKATTVQWSGLVQSSAASFRCALRASRRAG